MVNLRALGQRANDNRFDPILSNTLEVITFVWKYVMYFSFYFFFFCWNRSETNRALVKFSRSFAKPKKRVTFFGPEFVPKHKNSRLQREQLQKFLPGALHSLILTCGSSRELIFDVSAARRISANPRWPMERKCRARVTCRVIPTSLR